MNKFVYIEKIENKKPEVIIYTDGACSGNPGVGGWGVVLMDNKNHRKELFDGLDNTTNNKMELTAVIQALKCLKKPCKIKIYSDSKYVVDGITKWIINWQKTGDFWNENKLKNLNLWHELNKLTKNHEISWNWIKAHNGNIENERADYLARLGIKYIKENKEKL